MRLGPMMMQKHFVSSRSRRQRGILALVVREASQRVLIYGDAKITKETQNAAIFSFIERWKQRTGELPRIWSLTVALRPMQISPNSNSWSLLPNLIAQAVGLLSWMRSINTPRIAGKDPTSQYRTAVLQAIGSGSNDHVNAVSRSSTSTCNQRTQT